MKLPLIFASAITALVTAFSPFQPLSHASSSSDGGDIAGVYSCEGVRPDGAAYHGTVEIVRNNGTYELLWVFSSKEQYLGYGIVNENVLAVTVFGDVPGIVAYRIEHDTKGPKLVGRWTVPNVEGLVFGETLTKVGAATSTPRPPDAPHAPEAPPHGRVVPSRALRAA